MKVLYYLFYKINVFFKSISNDGWSEWKSLVVIGSAQVFVLIELIIWWTIITKSKVDIPKYYFIVFGLLITSMNYYIFKHNSNKYNDLFKSYSKRKNIIGGWFVFVLLLGIFGSLIYSFYRLSLVFN
ncbi:hypothetical protein CMT42_12895 [Elizabethkingia anophelis]|uniref:Uncharacterized protein n=1 Tax=Elizabethkingia anophelis TaxID=1117645 RepID=A0A1T3HLD9_9FLAO|nr:hypothetical protein BBD31_04760 [Elizabethkingia anophelis]AQX49490.1 hypothetical protein AYC66_01830 [Elizabethkingia anophelis]AQX87836.1 hypothetical protein AYC67_01830 [Elizabethkingia anophelis]ASV80378.1 hypothetical protein A6J37_18205 [Elizabethkingia anophelis]ELJ2643349.1 hypothetical protein [Elizabethkingia anophelis]